MLNNWRTKGLGAAEARFQSLDAARYQRRYAAPTYEMHVAGKLAFLSMVRGLGDRVYTRYAIEASKLTDARLAPAIQSPATEVLDFLCESLWVVVGRDANGYEVQQGTAFHLHGAGLVTARHVLDPNSQVHSWTVIRSAAPYDEYAITASKSHAGCDIAILVSDAKSHARLRRNTDTAFRGEDVTVIGFPNWRNHADRALRSMTKIVQTKIISAIRHASVSYPLLSGSSGGPVLDSSGYVVGVIVRSKDDVVLPNAFIEISPTSPRF